MPQSLEKFAVTQPFDDGQTFDSATGTSIASLEAAASQPWRLWGIVATSDDVVAHVVEVWFFNGGVDVLLGSAVVPAGAGTLGAPGFDLLAAAIPATTDGIRFNGAQALKVRFSVAITAAKHVYIYTAAGFY